MNILNKFSFEKSVKSGNLAFATLAAIFLSCNFYAYSQENENTIKPSQLADIDALINSAKQTQQPVVVPPISFVDVNNGRFGKLEIDLEEGQFLDTAVEKLHLLARNLDIQSGTLKSLSVQIKGGRVRDFLFDKLDMSTPEDLKFDPGIMVNHRILQFTTPAQANVAVTISQESLNKFLSAPNTLERFSTSATKRAGALVSLANMVGIKMNQIGLSVHSANLKLQRHNRFSLALDSKLGVGNLGLDINGVINGDLTLQNGVLAINNPQLITNGHEIPPEIAQILLKRINLIPALSQQSEDIRFNFNELKVSAGKRIELRGIAYVSRLRFGNAKG